MKLQWEEHPKALHRGYYTAQTSIDFYSLCRFVDGTWRGGPSSRMRQQFPSLESGMEYCQEFEDKYDRDGNASIRSVSSRLESLSKQMTAMANSMISEIGDDEAKQHAEELAGAANMVWQWSVKLQDQVRTK